MKYIIPTIDTDRLVLKKGTYDDYVKVYEYDFSRLRNIDGEFDFVKIDPETIKGFETYSEEEENVLDFIIYLKENDNPIGNVVFDKYDKEKKSLEISCNLHPKYWRQGYMTEALIATMKYVFNELDIDSIIYGYAEDNYKSKCLCNKIGFAYYYDYMEYYIRINKDIKEIKTIISRDEFNKKYNS